MSLQVLQNQRQIDQARKKLDTLGLSSLTGKGEAALKKLVARSRLSKPIVMGDYVKSWDVLETVEFLEGKLERGAPILDIGCYGSELLLALDKAGYTALSGVDLDPRITRMPSHDTIRYVVSDFMKAPFSDGAFDAVTSISVIEHGYDGKRLFDEVSRLLKPGGFFIASFDYWRDKIDTKDIRIFDMSWLLFSESDVKDMLAEAARHGLEPVGNLHFNVADRAIAHGGFNYTFAWLALQKQA